MYTIPCPHKFLQVLGDHFLHGISRCPEKSCFWQTREQGLKQRWALPTYHLLLQKIHTQSQGLTKRQQLAEGRRRTQRSQSLRNVAAWVLQTLFWYLKLRKKFALRVGPGSSYLIGFTGSGLCCLWLLWSLIDRRDANSRRRWELVSRGASKQLGGASDGGMQFSQTKMNSYLILDRWIDLDLCKLNFTN